MAKTRRKIGEEELQADVVSRQPDAGAPQSAGDTTTANPDRERIAMRAYELYLQRGEREGGELDDWLNAERELSPDRRTE